MARIAPASDSNNSPNNYSAVSNYSVNSQLVIYDLWGLAVRGRSALCNCCISTAGLWSIALISKDWMRFEGYAKNILTLIRIACGESSFIAINLMSPASCYYSSSIYLLLTIFLLYLLLSLPSYHFPTLLLSSVFSSQVNYSWTQSTSFHFPFFSPTITLDSTVAISTPSMWCQYWRWDCSLL